MNFANSATTFWSENYYNRDFDINQINLWAFACSGKLKVDVKNKRKTMVKQFKKEKKSEKQIVQ